jgi:hypothetical protein
MIPLMARSAGGKAAFNFELIYNGRCAPRFAPFRHSFLPAALKNLAKSFAVEDKTPAANPRSPRSGLRK